MSTVDYLILRNSVEQAAFVADPLTFQGHKFHVVLQGYKTGLVKRGEERETLGGVIDVAVGHIYWRATFVVFVAHTLSAGEIADNQGNYSDLENYFKLNNPLGTPSNLITLVDHLGTTHTGFLRGDHIPEPLTYNIEGEHALYYIPINFMEKEAVA